MQRQAGPFVARASPQGGEWQLAESGLTALIEQSESNQLLPYQALGLGLRGELFARRGEVEIGVAHLRESLQRLNGLRHMTMNTAFMINLAEALSISGRGAEGMTTIDAAIARIEHSQELTHLPVIVDPSHATGLASMVEAASRAAIEFGSHGLIIEVACDSPGAAKPKCDAAQAISPAQLGNIVRFLDARAEQSALRRAHAV